MKVLQLIPNLNGGGAERFTVDLINVLANDQGSSLLTLYDPMSDDFLRKALRKDVVTHSIGKKEGLDYKVFYRLYKSINKIKPDIIHCHLGTINYLMVIYPFLKKIPVVYTVHSDAFKDCPKQKIRLCRKQLFRKSVVIPITISNESKLSFQRAYKGIESKLILNGRAYPNKTKLYSKAVEEIGGFRFDSKTKVVVHIGRFTPEKNQLMLIDSFCQLMEEGNKNAMLLIIGRKRDKKESFRIHQQLKEMDSKYEYIHLLGERPNATDYLHAADYFCLSSKYEGMPITLIEAFATGCIPICTKAGGMPEMIRDLEPTLVPESIEKSDYYQLFKYALGLPEEKQESIKQRAIEIFDKKYSMEHCADQYLSLYKNLIKRN